MGATWAGEWLKHAHTYANTHILITLYSLYRSVSPYSAHIWSKMWWLKLLSVSFKVQWIVEALAYYNSQIWTLVRRGTNYKSSWIVVLWQTCILFSYSWQLHTLLMKPFPHLCLYCLTSLNIITQPLVFLLSTYHIHACLISDSLVWSVVNITYHNTAKYPVCILTFLSIIGLVCDFLYSSFAVDKCVSYTFGYSETPSAFIILFRNMIPYFINMTMAFILCVSRMLTTVL